MAKKKKEKVDGLSADDIKKIRIAIRKVWSWSTPRKMCDARSKTHPDGFPRCEMCKKKAPKIYIDHIKQVGDVDGGFIARLFCPSTELQAICKKCHDTKTKEERKTKKKGDIQNETIKKTG